MTKFIEIPASEMSLKARGLIQGRGVNDASYQVNMVSGGKNYTCPIYRIWVGMVARCYSPATQKVNPCYVGCSVSDDWLLFSRFSNWMTAQDWVGNQMDKDIIKSRNKIYSDETCIFVTSDINSLLTSRQANKGLMPIGVRRSYKRYAASCSVYGVPTSIGSFDTADDAGAAFLAFKSKHVLEVALKQDEPLRGYLVRISNEIACGEYFK